MLALCHSSYSLQAGVCTPERWAQAARSAGYEALALADINGLYGAVNFYNAAADAGLVPLIGATLRFTGPFSFMAFPMNDQGYRQLCRIVTRRHLHPEEGPEAVLQEEGIADLLFLSHTLPCINLLSTVVPAENLYLLPMMQEEEQAHIGSRRRQSPRLWDTAEIPGGCRYAPLPDAWFIQQEDVEPFIYREKLRRMADGDEPIPLYAGAQLPDAAAWCRRFPDAPRAMEEIVRRCSFRFSFDRTLLPQVHLPDSHSPAEHLRTLCLEGWRRKYADTAYADAATQRLEHELAVILRNGFADYFLYVHEIISFAHGRDIPVGVRGSAASSLVSYLLDFTYSCPLENDLYFERFMNPGRTDCPDIDLDIADNRRDEVIAFCYRQWGDAHVGMITNLQTYHTRSAYRDAARLLQLPLDDVQRALETGGTLPDEKRLTRVAKSLHGLPRHLGLHCGGVVITPCPLTDVTPLCRSGKGVAMTQYEKDQAEKIGLVKMDLLGNSALSVIHEAVDWIREKKPNITLQDCTPRYDYKINRALAKGDTLGVYQCESPGMRQLCRAVRPKTPKEVAATLSLIRPGPASAGMKGQFIRRRRKQEPVAYLHPRMADFLHDTYGVMLYQEDVMKVAVNLAAYSPGEADSLRRSLSKKADAAPVEDVRHEFITDKASQAGIPRKTAEAIWEQVSRFASYAYCKAHATVYGRLAWITAFLKTHYPEAFTAATLNHHKSMYPERLFVWDAIRHGIPVLPPDVTRSELHWAPTGRGVRSGLHVIKGIRRHVCDRIVSARRRQPFADFQDFRTRVPCRVDELVRLISAGACRRFGSRASLLHALRKDGTQVRQRALFDVAEESQSSQLLPMPYAELMATDIPFSAHPAEPLTDVTCRAEEMHQFINQEVTMAGIMDAIKTTRTEQGNKEGTSRLMSFVTLEDASGTFELLLFPDMHARYSHIFTHLGPYRVKGRITTQWDSVSLEVTSVQSETMPLRPEDRMEQNVVC